MPVIDRPVTRALEQAIADHGAGHGAVRFGDLTWTLGELLDVSGRVACGLRHLGVGAGDRVAVYATNVPEHVFVMLACARLGAIYTGVNPQWSAPEVAFLVRDAGIRVLFVNGATVGTASEVCEVAPGIVEHLVPVDGPAMAALMSQADAGPYFADPDSPVALWYTSGSSGRPKGALWSHRSFLYNGLAWMEQYGIGSTDRCVAAFPIAHNSLGVCIASILSGAELVIEPGFDPGRLIQTIQRLGVTMMPTSPSMISILRTRARVQGVSELPSMRTMPVGTGPSTADFRDSFRAFFPNARIYNCYGASEGIFSLYKPDDPAGKRGSVGRPLPGVTMRVVDDQGRPLGTGEIGRLEASGPGNMLYYWGRPEATADVLHHGWLTVGDLGYIDADGYVWIVSRDSDVINSGGFNVYASEVERVIAAVPGVRAVAVLGEPDEVLGERVVAIIEAAAGSGLAAADIEAACVRGLARYKRPAVIRFVSELAVDDMGKVRKHLLHRS